MWGTHSRRRPWYLAARFIPTYVGNTQPTAYQDIRVSVHPHVCGEHLNLSHELNQPFGSSPRMWGTPTSDSCLNVYFRFIPTYVGNTSTKGVFTTSCRFIPTYVGNTRYTPGIQISPAVHPHVCGEHVKHSAHWNLNNGSSPRMWGTQELGLPRLCR